MSRVELPADLPTCLARYRADCGIDAEVTDHGRIIVRAGAVGCIRIPARLGKRVADVLESRDLSTPIIVCEVTASWRFLTQRPSGSELFDPLFIYQGKQSGYGAEISLPTPGYPGRTWRVVPTGPERLPSATVVALTLEQAEAMSQSPARAL